MGMQEAQADLNKGRRNWWKRQRGPHWNFWKDSWETQNKI